MRKIWILLFLASPAFGQDATSVYRDNVVIVVDASGSMGNNWSGTNDERMSIAKKAMKTVLSETDENTQIGILVFGGASSKWVYPLGPKDNEALEKAIESIRTGGGTPLGTNIKKGADALLVQREKQYGYGSYRLLIVTDGETSGSEQSKMERFTPEIMARGINVDVIGVDMKKAHSLAAIVGSNYHAADKPATLTKAITDVFAEIQKDAAGGVADFELLEGLDPRLAMQIIGALAKPQNHPIGENPPRPKTVSPKATNNISTSTDDWDGSVTQKRTWPIWLFGSIGLVAIVIIVVKTGH